MRYFFSPKPETALSAGVGQTALVAGTVFLLGALLSGLPCFTGTGTTINLAPITTAADTNLTVATGAIE